MSENEEKNTEQPIEECRIDQAFNSGLEMGLSMGEFAVDVQKDRAAKAFLFVMLSLVVAMVWVDH